MTECVFSGLLESVSIATHQRNYGLLYRALAALVRELQSRTLTRVEILAQIQGLDCVVRAMITDLMMMAGGLSSHVVALPMTVVDASTVRLLLSRLHRPVQGIVLPASLLNAAYELGQAPRLISPAAAAIYADVETVKHMLHTVLITLDADRRN